MRIDSTDGVGLELHDLGGEGPPVLVVHATGFCAGAYRPLAASLETAHHVWAVDVRAHGDSSVPASGDLSWRAMTDDVLAAIEAIGGGPVLAFGHSMGGACLVAAELRVPGTLRAAFLYEPIIIPAAWGEAPNSNPLAASARRRRPAFASRSEALDRYARRPPLGSFRADALAAYVDHGFRDTAAGVELKCSPEHEAQVFEASGKPTIESVGAVSTPIVVGYGARDGTSGPEAFAPAIAEGLPNGVGVQYRHLGHFGPFQDPDTLAEDAHAHFARN